MLIITRFSYTILGLLFLFLSSNSHAQKNENTWEENFKKAGDFYLARDYDSAIVYYQDLEKEWMTSGLYYNLGNAYFQKNELGLATLYFEKAHKLDPLNEDIQNNLALVQKQQSDNFTNKDFTTSFFDKVSTMLGFSDWIRWAWITAGLFWISFAIFLFVRALRWLSLISFLSTFMGTIFFITMSYHSYNLLLNPQFAIVLLNNASIYTEPSNNANVLHILHEGAKLKILGENTKYYQIQTLSNSKGWIKKEFVQGI